MMPIRRPLLAFFPLLIALAACKEQPPSARGAATSASAATVPSAGGTASRIPLILAAEQRRAAGDIGAADQQSRDVGVRRAAARALARIGGDAARAGLVRALSDEDEDVVAWGAYGLGYGCKDHESDNVSTLVARALSRDAGPDGARNPVPPAASSGSAAASPARLDALGAIARAIGRCGAETSEPTLVAWLGGPRDRAIHASYGLGDLAGVKLKLREETLVALLNLAAGSAASPPLPEALYPIGRLEHVPPTVMARIRDVAASRLAEPGNARLFAVRALGRAGEAAIGELTRVLTTPGVFTAGERAEAARGLKRLEAAGQRALAQAVSSLVPSADSIALSGLVGPDLGVLLTVLDSLDSAGAARKALHDLAALIPPPSAPASLLRRVTLVRCSAAKLLVGDNYRDPLLLGCDVTAPSDAAAKPEPATSTAGAGAAGAAPGAPVERSIGARAIVDVLGRGELTGARLAAWRSYVDSGDVRAREAALELIATHDEILGTPQVLAKAFAAAEPGIASTAAEVIAKQPQRASEASGKAAGGRRKRGKRKHDAKEDAPVADTAPGAVAAPAVVEALLAVLTRPGAGDDPELIDTVIDAVGALALKQAEARLDELCRSSYPTTRMHSGKALGLIRGSKIACEGAAASDKGASIAPPAGDLPVEVGALVREPVTLTFDTDAGALTITLDPALAPIAVTRFVDLARSGYYDGKIVHRVAFGFVTQFGAPLGDGFGGPPGRPALRCETSPLPFEPLRVGVALSGRDTGSSQLFVMHSRAPHLDGQYALVGAAAGAWDALIDGDVIRGVKVGN